MLTKVADCKRPGNQRTVGLFVSVVLFFQLSLLAQESNPIVVSAGFNIVDNSGSRFNELLNVTENWNVARNIKVAVEKRFKYDFGAEAALSLNKFNSGKKINSETNDGDLNYLSLDFMVKNYTTNYYQNTKRAFYEGYFTGGFGANLIGRELAKTLNFGLGLNIKINHELRISLQTMGKFSIDSATSGNANHIQHSITLIKWI